MPQHAESGHGTEPSGQVALQQPGRADGDPGQQIGPGGEPGEQRGAHRRCRLDHHECGVRHGVGYDDRGQTGSGADIQHRACLRIDAGRDGGDRGTQGCEVVTGH